LSTGKKQLFRLRGVMGDGDVILREEIGLREMNEGINMGT